MISNPMPALDFQLRDASEADIPALMGLADTTDLSDWSESDFSNVIDGQRGLLTLAFAREVLAGFIASSSVVDEVTLLNLAVGRGHRRHGLGRALVQNMLAHYRIAGAARCLLEVRESNSGARALYTELGFTVDGRRPDYYLLADGREDAVLMSLELEKGLS